MESMKAMEFDYTPLHALIVGGDSASDFAKGIMVYCDVVE